MALFLAHRGASYLAPENTMVSFQLARSLEAHGYECDVQRCKSGEIVIFHDRNFRRTVKPSEKLQSERPDIRDLAIPDLTLKEISQLDVGSWKEKSFTGEKVARLEELLEWVSREQNEFLMVEIKLFGLRTDGLAAQVVEILNRYPALHERLLVASFHTLVVWHLKQLKPKFQVGFISEVSPAWYRNRRFWLPMLNPDVFVVEFSKKTIPEIRQAKRRGMKVFCWTLDTLDVIQEAIDEGADAVISNRPELLAQMPEPLARHFHF